MSALQLDQQLLDGQDRRLLSRYYFPKISTAMSQHPAIDAARSNNMKTLTQILESTQQLNLLKDEYGRTMLHYVALNNNSYVFNRLLNKYPSAEWINAVDKYQYTCYQYIAYNGNIELLEQVVKLVNIRNCMGLAAMNGQLQTMIYLKDICNTDTFDDNISPLHLACVTGQDSAAILLMSWNHNVNARDSERQTPLHICAIQGHIKLIRKLFYRGAEPKLKNIYNKKPKDIAKDNETLAAITSYRLSFKSVCLQMNIKPRTKSYKQFIILITFLIILNGLTIITSLNVSIKYWLSTLYYSVNLLNIVALLAVSFQLPGYAIKQSDLMQLLDQYPLYEVCLECSLITPPRSKHCEFCRRCVLLYDHHCPWVNNCIGKYNLPFFITFIITLLIDVVLSIIICCIGAADITKPTFNIPGHMYIQIVIASLAFLFLLPLCNLLYVQVLNISQDKTTYERLILEKPRTEKRQSIIQRSIKLQ